MKNLICRYFTQSPFLCFLPFGIFYVLIVLIFRSDTLFGDESRYLGFAENLLHGFYSPPFPAINIWSGPGYPLLLMPFVWFKLPLISVALLNAGFQYLSLVLLFFTFKHYVAHKIALIFSFAWAMYYPAYLWAMPLIVTVVTESLTIFLVTLMCYSLAKAFALKVFRYKNLLIPACVIGFLVLTKIVFGYVLLVLLAGAIVYFFLKKNLQAKKILFCL